MISLRLNHISFPVWVPENLLKSILKILGNGSDKKEENIRELQNYQQASQWTDE